MQYTWADVKQEIDDEFKIIMKDMARLEVWDSFAGLAADAGLPMFQMSVASDPTCVIMLGVPQDVKSTRYAKLKAQTDGTIEVAVITDDTGFTTEQWYAGPAAVIEWIKSMGVIPAEQLKMPEIGEKNITALQLNIINPRAFMRLHELVFFQCESICIASGGDIIAYDKFMKRVMWDSVADSWI